MADTEQVPGASSPKKKLGVTFQIEQDEEDTKKSMEQVPSAADPVKRRHRPSTLSWTSAKFLFLALIAVKCFVRLFVLAYELARVFGMREPDMVHFPMMEEAMWAPFRIELMRHLVCQMLRLVLDDGLLLTVIQQDLIYVAWYEGYNLLVRLFGEQVAMKHWFEMVKSALFLQVALISWLAKEYLLGAVMATLHIGMEDRPYFWPHQQYSPIWLAAVEVVGLTLAVVLEWLGNFRYFGLGATLLVAVGNTVGHLVAPLPGLLKLRFTGLGQVEPNSHLHDILLSLGRMCRYPMSNFYIDFGSKTWGFRSLGYRTLSAVIIDYNALEYLEYLAPILRTAFPETSGPDDVDQMVLAAAAHEIGHAMTGQVLWYDIIGYGLLASAVTWFILEHLVKRPILFRSFGFRLWPIPPACAILITILFLSTTWQLMLVPLANLVDWMRELEADSYAASLGFGISMQKYLYTKQAAQTSIARAFTTLRAIYENSHPPYHWRTQALD